MEETIISINSANIVSVAIMVLIIFTALYFVMMMMGKMKANGND